MSDPESLSLQIADIFNKKKFSDIKFVVGEESVEYYGHKLILALRSSAFANLFYGGSTEETVFVPDIQPSIFYKVLQYIYADFVQFDSIKEARDVHKVGKKYDIPTLQAKCHDYISKRVVPFDMACKMFEISTSPQLQFKHVEKLCQEVFVHQTKFILQSEQFLKTKVSTVVAILGNDRLAIESEMDILQAVLKWGKAQCFCANQFVTDKNLRHHIEPLLKFIRFLVISLSDLQQFFKTSNVLNAEEVFALISVKLQPHSDIKLPDSLCIQDQDRCLPIKWKEENADDEFYDCEESFSGSDIHKINNELDLSLWNAAESASKPKNVGGTRNMNCLTEAKNSYSLKFENKISEQKDSFLPPGVCQSMENYVSESNPVFFSVDSNMDIAQFGPFTPISMVSGDDNYIACKTDCEIAQSSLASLSVRPTSYFNNWQRKLGSCSKKK